MTYWFLITRNWTSKNERCSTTNTLCANKIWGRWSTSALTRCAVQFSQPTDVVDFYPLSTLKSKEENRLQRISRKALNATAMTTCKTLRAPSTSYRAKLQQLQHCSLRHRVMTLVSLWMSHSCWKTEGLRTMRMMKMADTTSSIWPCCLPQRLYRKSTSTW